MSQINFPIKVLHMTKLGAGGISTLTVSINKCLDLKKVHFDYLVFEDQNTFYENDIKKLGAVKQIADVSNSKNKLDLYWNKFLGVRKILKKCNYDVMHVDASTPLDIVIGMAAKSVGIKKIILHSHIAGDNKKSVARYIYMNICRMLMPAVFTHYLAISDEAARYMFPKWIASKGNYIIVKNGIMANSYKFNNRVRIEEREKLKITNKIVIGHVGRFSEEKNHSFIIDVFEKILNMNNNVILLLIGTGKLEKKIKQKVSDKNMLNEVIFYGVSHNIPKLMMAMDSFIFPSKYEGLGIAAIEAQCSGLMTYCSEGIPEETNITNCFRRIEGYNPDLWANKICMDIDNFVNKMRNDRIKEIRNAGFDIAEVAKAMTDFYISC